MRLSPDGYRYLSERPPRPFAYRWLIPYLTGRNPRRFAHTTRAHLVALPFVAAWWVNDWRLAVFVIGCAGVVSIGWRFPVLVDVPAHVWALVASGAALRGWWPVAVVAALVAGAISERAPIFAALWAWSPVPLVGVLAAGWWRKHGPDVLDERNAWILAHPFRAAWESHRQEEPWAFVLPWGAGLLACVAPTWQLAATCVVAYLMCAAATDTVRLYQWAWPVVGVAALGVLEGAPAGLLVLVAVLHLVNPYRTDGI